MQARGRAILMDLMKINRRLDPLPQNGLTVRMGNVYNTIVRPRLSHSIQDLIDVPASSIITAVNFVYGETVPHVRQADIIASSMMATERPDRIEGQPILGAFSIPFSANGLGQCEISAHPYDSDSRFLFDKNKEDSIDWMSILTPAGAITQPHIDYHGALQLMCHIQGRKLWFTWPATPGNVKLLHDRELREGRPVELQEAIGILEGLELILLDEIQCSFYLPPGMIHTAISFTTCCHAGVYVWALDDFPIARNLMEYHLSFAAESNANLIQATNTYLDDFCLTIDNQELVKWSTLASDNIQDDISTEIIEWIKRTRAQLCRLIKIRNLSHLVPRDETFEKEKEVKKRKKSHSKVSDKNQKRKRD
jgi:hypothetical protein